MEGDGLRRESQVQASDFEWERSNPSQAGIEAELADGEWPVDGDRGAGLALAR